MFVAIKGDRFDANTFAKDALQKGAKFVIIDNAHFLVDERTILVKDSLIALQQLATFHRRYLNLPVIALTGSNGKTTTKELINAVLSQRYKTVATVGNLNNHIGVPLTLLSFTKQTQIGIVEMGANHQKEIEFLCEIAEPDYGYITNFGKAHLEGFGGAEGVIKGKSEMYAYLSKHSKMAFVNLEDPIQVQRTTTIKRFTFGKLKVNADLNIVSIVADPFVAISVADVQIRSNMIGIYNAANISAAIAMGIYFQVSVAECKHAIEQYIPENNRSQMIRKGSVDIILDAYNANPSSMRVAVDNFLQLQGTRKIMILGDMFELGSESIAEHEIIVQYLVNADDVECHFVGKDFYSVQVQRRNFHFHEDYDSFAAQFTLKIDNPALMLIKGSRGMALERVLELIDSNASRDA